MIRGGFRGALRAQDKALLQLQHRGDRTGLLGVEGQHYSEGSFPKDSFAQLPPSERPDMVLTSWLTSGWFGVDGILGVGEFRGSGVEGSGLGTFADLVDWAYPEY